MKDYIKGERKNNILVKNLKRKLSENLKTNS